jgi:hypothetical protein
MMFVGRLWLHGPNTPTLLACEDLRFGFPNNSRPQDLPPYELDPGYHSISERTDSKKPRIYRTVEKDGIRIDYGLVQVYTVNNGRYPTTIVLCAGSSSLGTMGAAMWLTYDLGRPLSDLNGRAIPLPPGNATRHRMEALLRVEAKPTTYAWQPKDMKLCTLQVDDFTWSGLQWQRTQAPRLELHMHGESPGTIYVNGRATTFNSGSQLNRLAVAVIQAIANSSQHCVHISELAENKEIWGPDGQDNLTVKRRLCTINKQQLEGMLEVGDEVRIKGDVRIVDADALARNGAKSV